MRPSNLHYILIDPLAGCLSIAEQEENYTTLSDYLFLRLRLFYRYEVCERLIFRIESEASNYQIMPAPEYAINEMQFELRLVSRPIVKAFTASYETRVLHEWAKKLMHRYDSDAVLDFILRLKMARDKRERC